MGYNVLIVDDSSIIRSVLRKSLVVSGLELGEVFEAANGKEALIKMADNWIDIIFSDLNMPEMDGVEMVKKMAEDSVLSSTPVVIVSSERNQDVIEDLKRTGIRAYIKKPVRPESLRDVVAEVLTNASEEG